MLLTEARWLGRALEQADVGQLSPMLNAGSHTEDFRQRVQPWIDQHVLAPLVARGVDIQYADLRPGSGVDHVGDLTDPDFVSGLRAEGFRSVLCSNLLEHVPEPQQMADVLQNLLSADGLVIYSGPCKFPYHADPIDNMFRPTPGEVAQAFSRTRVLVPAEVSCGTFTSYLARRLLVSPSRVLRDLCAKSRGGNPVQHTLASPRAAVPTSLPPGDVPDGRSAIVRLAPWLVRRFTATCAVLEVQAASNGLAT